MPFDGAASCVMRSIRPGAANCSRRPQAVRTRALLRNTVPQSRRPPLRTETPSTRIIRKNLASLIAFNVRCRRSCGSTILRTLSLLRDHWLPLPALQRPARTGPCDAVTQGRQGSFTQGGGTEAKGRQSIASERLVSGCRRVACLPACPAQGHPSHAESSTSLQ